LSFRDIFTGLFSLKYAKLIPDLMFLIAAGATLRLREENGVTNHVAKELAVALGACLLAMALSGPTLAASPHQGSVGSSGAAVVTGSLPGQVLWGYYLTTQSGELCPPGANTTGDILCNTEGAGDNIIRLVNPNGAANANLAGAKAETVCAMVYVFDDDQEMGECCGCPVTSAQLATFSVEKNLTSNWALRGGERTGVALLPSWQRCRMLLPPALVRVALAMAVVTRPTFPDTV
jgi:hypothetical protein